MLEIIALIFLTRRIGAKALQKGQPKGKWQGYMVLAWVGFEIGGAMLGYMISQNLVLAVLLGLGCAVGGYLLVNHKLSQMPDKGQDWMDQIGQQ